MYENERERAYIRYDRRGVVREDGDHIPDPTGSIPLRLRSGPLAGHVSGFGGFGAAAAQVLRELLRLLAVIVDDHLTNAYPSRVADVRVIMLISGGWWVR